MMMLASGAIILSTLECEISLSCHKETFSKAGIVYPRINLERPVKFSVSTGFLLCGMAEEPFCPFEKNSSTSRTSVLCKCLISVARRSIELAIIPRVLK